MKMVLQMVAYALFFALVGYFSSRPDYSHLQPGTAMVSISFSHAGQRIGECRRLSQDELLALPPNMRKPDECPRERHPLIVRFAVDGKDVYAKELQPSGLWSDGKTTVYERFEVTAGKHSFDIRMRDSGVPDYFDYRASGVWELHEGQNLVLYFDSSSKAFAVD